MKKIFIPIFIKIIIAVFLWESVAIIYKKFLKNKKQIHLKFFKNFLQALIIVFSLYEICVQFQPFEKFSSYIFASSSLLVVVLGFAFQTSLEDFIAGILISIFKPFNIDDRITLVGLQISGYVESITIRHTIIKTFQNNRLIIPNSIMNKEIIENTNVINQISAGYMDVIISFDSNIEKAKEIIHDAIIENEFTIKDDVEVFVRDITGNGVALRANVTTENIDINFNACSQIREIILKKFQNENDIKFARNEQELYGNMNINIDKSQ